MADVELNSLRGGMNNSDPAIALPDDQCVLAKNVEFVESMLGERRRGSLQIDTSSSDLAGKDRVTFLHRHLPTSDEADAELWALGVAGAASALCRKTTSWLTVVPVDAITLTDGYQYQLQAQTLHGKMFLAYKSAVDRLHVYVDGVLRRTGVGEPAAPTAADSGGAGALTGTRYYRVRYIRMSGTTVQGRSEPSEILTHTITGTTVKVVVTKPASISESETHWELEGATDGATFRVVATTAVGTPTVDDTNADFDDFPLSPDAGDYANIHSGEFLSVDEDRLLIGGSFEDDDLASRVSWTVVFNDPGDGNDERIPQDTTNFLDLDTFEGGKLTGLSHPVLGSVWAFKSSHIYKLVRTGDRSRAYEPVTITKQMGAIKGSIVAGRDQRGMACLYFLDPQIGPCRIGVNGIQACGADLRTTWKTLNPDATDVVCRSVFYPEARQVHWWIAETGEDRPTLRIVLQTNESRDFADGVRRGWAVWDGNSAKALAVCLFSTNIDADTDRNKVLVPFIAVEGDGLVQQTDTGITDNGTAYAAVIKTKPYKMKTILHRFGVRVAALLAKAATGITLYAKLYRDFEIETTHVDNSIDLTPTVMAEGQVIRKLDSFAGSELHVCQVEFGDVDEPLGRWELNQFVMLETGQQKA